jgi:hypothetical protein
MCYFGRVITIAITLLVALSFIDLAYARHRRKSAGSPRLTPAPLYQSAFAEQMPCLEELERAVELVCAAPIRRQPSFPEYAFAALGGPVAAAMLPGPTTAMILANSAARGMVAQQRFALDMERQRWQMEMELEKRRFNQLVDGP